MAYLVRLYSRSPKRCIKKVVELMLTVLLENQNPPLKNNKEELL